MRKFLWSSLLGASLAVCAFASEALDSPKKISEELKKKYPIKEWKTIGFCGFKKEPIIHMKVPKFLNWDPECNLHTVKNGIEYCGPDDVTRCASGVVVLEGKDRLLQVCMEFFKHKKRVIPKVPNLSSYDIFWGKYGALIKNEVSTLGGYGAIFSEIEDKNGSLPRSIKVQTLIDFSQPYVGGMLYFIETEKDASGDRFVPHTKRVFQWAIDEMIESFEFKVKVSDEKPNFKNKK